MFVEVVALEQCWVVKTGTDFVRVLDDICLKRHLPLMLLTGEIGPVPQQPKPDLEELLVLLHRLGAQVTVTLLPAPLSPPDAAA